MGFLTDAERTTVAAAADRLVPAVDGHPGAAALGVVDYIDGLLDAFAVDPPRIWAGGPYSGGPAGHADFERFLALSPLEALAWRTRIEGSLGIPERERLGPVIGWQERYRAGVAALGADFATVDAEEQDARLDAVREFRTSSTSTSWRARTPRPSTSATATSPAGPRSGSRATSSRAATPTRRWRA